MRKTYCFDLVDTICYPNHEYNDTQRRYLEAKPNNIVINKINILHDLGNEIIIFTARRMITHNGDIKKIKADVELILINWLKKYKVNYDRLLFGKPYADFYIDDKAIELITPKFLYALIASLYLSLIPLHTHNSQNQKLYYQEYNYFFNLSKKEKL